ncbi:hypothetical protein L596_027683 [Steinernema carpocapsae]|uniref:RNA-dependent RNA polymerase n=1 Tax=Steinernema carpocapsae TaxID=34508 RepID=A0A4V5ZXV0_STECR|nr:hypothetical protein L596_027683 [Steinernema carpocapsae]
MILRGPVLMTKNPQIVAGDARMYDAVDIPELHHLVDVVVFPKYGPRPHPDEMAGSDLDGDEYTILWDPEFFFDRNEEPLDFPKPLVTANPEDDRDVNAKMIDFYISYIEQDSIGTIANSFLVTSDLYGIDSEVSISIARKHSLAVDFPKTGKPPEKLTQTPKNGMPPEQPDRFPDFMERSTSPAYVSSSLNGQLYRRAKEMDSVLSQITDRQQTAAILLDPEMEVEGAEKFYEAAVAMHNAYNACIEALLDNYGIVNEAEAFTGAIIKCRTGSATRTPTTCPCSTRTSSSSSASTERSSGFEGSSLKNSAASITARSTKPAARIRTCRWKHRRMNLTEDTARILHPK